jgi:hypothetical protein
LKTEKPEKPKKSEKPKKPESPRGLEAPEPTIKAKEKLIYRRCHHHALETIEPEWLHTSRHYLSAPSHPATHLPTQCTEAPNPATQPPSHSPTQPPSHSRTTHPVPTYPASSLPKSLPLTACDRTLSAAPLLPPHCIQTQQNPTFVFYLFTIFCQI